MRRVNRSSLVIYSAEQMFDLVNDVEAYPKFLPGCTGASVDEHGEGWMLATVKLSKGSMNHAFTTRNTLTKPSAIDLSLVGGPFETLSGGWRFVQLGEEGSKVSLELDFQFENRLVDMMFGSFFEDLCNSLVDAFTRRADVIYRNE